MESCHTVNESRDMTHFEWSEQFSPNVHCIHKYTKESYHMVNESCHLWISPVTYGWVIYSSMIWKWHVTYERVISHTHESRHIWISLVTYEWVMKLSMIWMSHVTYERVMSHMHESCHVSMSHVTYEWVLSRMNESSHVCTRTSTCQHVRTRQSERINLHVWGGYD